MIQLRGRHYEVGMSVSVSLPNTTLRHQLEAAYRALETLGRDREKWRREVVALDAAVKSAILQRDALLGQLEDGLTWPESFRRPYEGRSTAAYGSIGACVSLRSAVRKYFGAVRWRNENACQH
jgi:hypothetical protein